MEWHDWKGWLQVAVVIGGALGILSSVWTMTFRGHVKGLEALLEVAQKRAAEWEATADRRAVEIKDLTERYEAEARAAGLRFTAVCDGYKADLDHARRASEHALSSLQAQLTAMTTSYTSLRTTSDDVVQFNLVLQKKNATLEADVVRLTERVRVLEHKKVRVAREPQTG